MNYRESVKLRLEASLVTAACDAIILAQIDSGNSGVSEELSEEEYSAAVGRIVQDLLGQLTPAELGNTFFNGLPDGYGTAKWSNDA